MCPDQQIPWLILKQTGIVIKLDDYRRRTAASYAAQKGLLWILKLLFKRNETVLGNVDKDGRTPLIWAAREGLVKPVRFIPEHRGGNLNKQDEFGATCLIIAAREGHLLVVRTLLEFGADVRLKTKRVERRFALRGKINIVKSRSSC